MIATQTRMNTCILKRFKLKKVIHNFFSCDESTIEQFNCEVFVKELL